MEKLQKDIIKYLEENEGYGITITTNTIVKNNDCIFEDYLALDTINFKNENNCIKINGFKEFEEGDENNFRRKTQYILKLNDIKNLELDACSLSICYKSGQQIELTNWN